MNEILRIENLSFVYGKGTPFEKVALDNVTVSFEKGKITGLFQKNIEVCINIMKH